MTGMWSELSDEALDEELLRAAARLDAVQHTIKSLTRERAFRDRRPDHANGGPGE